VFKNIFKTVMDVKEKIKDNIKAIMDITFYLYRSYKHRLLLLHTHTHTHTHTHKSLIYLENFKW
jgi:hypothetical protein